MGMSARMRVHEAMAATPTLTDLAADGVHVWMVRLHDVADLHAGLLDVLSPDERARAERFRFPVDQRRFVATRGALRLALGAYGDAAPRELAFDYVCVCGHPHCAMSRRKPVLQPGYLPADVRFNVSHSDEVALIAVSLAREVGVDIERIRPEIEWRALAEEALSPADAAAVLARQGREGLLAFYRCWTHKEAFLKAMGRGLTTPRALQPKDLAAPALERLSEHTWAYDDRVFSARTLDGTPPDCVAALVVEAAPSEAAVVVRALALQHLLSAQRASGRGATN